MHSLTPTEVVILQPFAKAIAPAAMERVGRSLNWIASQVREAFTNTFAAHQEATRKKCSRVRTLNSPDTLTNISEIYVNLNVVGCGTIVLDEDLLSQVDEYRIVLLVGTGGAGKSMVMRHLALQAMSTEYEQVPLFIDLRDVADPRITPFLDSLFTLVSTDLANNARSLFNSTLREGVFCLFLDGMDEVAPDFRGEMRKQISALIRTNSKIKIIMSSRPDVDFSGWTDFAVYNLSPATRDQTSQIIEKCKYHDHKVKIDFLTLLNNGEFEKYSSFLEVPLLSIILLMCFGEHLELSKGTTPFYEQAYEALYRRHDRTKDLLRTNFSGLAQEQFRKVLSAFCYKSLADRDVSFTEEQLARYLSRACDIADVKAEAVALSKDIVESVPILYRDGSKLYFIHRTFQEYFAAHFITRYKGNETFQVYDSVLCGGMSSMVSSMVAEIDSYGLELAWSKPVLDELIEKLVEPCHNHLSHVLTSLMVTLGVQHDPTGRLAVKMWRSNSEQIFFSRLNALYDIYGDEKIRPLWLISGYLLADLETSISDVLASQYELPVGLQVTLEGGAMFSINTKRDPLEWLTLTSVGVNLSQFLQGIQELSDIVNERVARRARSSIFS